MKVGDIIKLKPAMWQGIKPESYGLSFTGEYVVRAYEINGQYDSVRLEGVTGIFDRDAFQLVFKNKENKVSKFKVGDEVVVIKNTPVCQEGLVGVILGISAESTLDGRYYAVAKDGDCNSLYYLAPEELQVLSRNKLPQESGHKSSSALDKQISGDHYKSCGIQPIEYIHANGLSYLEGNVIKYTTRHSKKNGRQDIEKAIHYLELILEMEYKDDTE